MAGSVVYCTLHPYPPLTVDVHQINFLFRIQKFKFIIFGNLHWIILGFLYALFVHWSIFPSSKSNLSFERSKWHFPTPTLCSFVSYTSSSLTVFSSSICHFKTWHSPHSKYYIIISHLISIALYYKGIPWLHCGLQGNNKWEDQSSNCQG